MILTKLRRLTFEELVEEQGLWNFFKRVTKYHRLFTFLGLQPASLFCGLHHFG